MKLSDRRKEIHGAVEDRVQESIDRTGSGPGIFRPELQIKQWRDKSQDENHSIDVLPYIVGENPSNPKVRPGDIAYSAEYFTHRNIGPNNDRVLCLAKSFNKPCPICEHRKELSDKYGFEDEKVQALKPSRQVLYNIIVYDTPAEEQKGVQVWLVAHWYFERFISDLAKASRGRGKVAFADPDVGKTIEFKRQGKENVTYSAHQFIDRAYKISDDLLNSTYCLEDLVNIPTYDEVATLYYGKKDSATQTEVTTVQTEVRAEQKASTVSSQSTGVKCPGGGTLGIDINNLDYCMNCESFDECTKVAEKSEMINRATPPVEQPASASTPVASRRRNIS